MLETLTSYLSAGLITLTSLFSSGQVLQAQTINCDTDFPNSWPQVAHDAQRSGKAPEDLGVSGTGYDKDGNGRIEYHATNQTINDVAWRHAFQPDKVFPQVQAIVYCGKVFVGTEGANGQTASIYAFAAQGSGVGTQSKVDWVYPVGSPVLASVAAGDGKVFFGAMNGTVYALNAQTGAKVWETTPDPHHGFSTAPVFADNKVMLGGRNGKFYAFNKDNGAKLWERDIDAPILQTAAYNVGSDSKKRVFVGGMDMYLYALDVTNSGTVLWKSKVKGMAMKDYYPVVHKDQHKVLVTPMRDHRVGVKESDLPVCDANPNDPNCKITMRIFDELTGVEQQQTVPHDNVPLHNGTMTPPCVWDSESVVLSAKDKPDAQGGKGSWSQVNIAPGSPNYRKIVDQFIDGSGENGYNNTDETQNLSCTTNTIFALHYNGTNSGAGYSGIFHIPTDKWISYNVGRVSNEMGKNLQGGGGNAPSIANGYFYHLAQQGIIAVNTN